MQKPTYPVSLTFPVRWGEMDAFGHVNNTVYFRYFEDVRIKAFENLGLGSLDPVPTIAPILAHTGCQFMHQLSFPATVTVGGWIEKTGNTSFQLDYEVYSEKDQKVVARGTSIIVLLNYKTGGKITIDDQLREKLNAMRRKQ